MEFRFLSITFAFLLLGTTVFTEEDTNSPGSCTVSVYSVGDTTCDGTPEDTFEVEEGKCSSVDSDFYMANSIGDDKIVLQLHASEDDCKNGLGEKVTSDDSVCFDLDGAYYKVSCPKHKSKKYAITKWNEDGGTIRVSDICQPDDASYAKHKCFGFGRVKEVYSDDACSKENLVEHSLMFDGSNYVCGDDLPKNSYIEYIDQGLDCKYKTKGDFYKLDTCITSVGFKYTVKGDHVVRTTYKDKEECKDKDFEDEFKIEECNNEESQDQSHYIQVTGSGLVPKAVALTFGLLMTLLF